jgi:cyclic dehypoxanthinyl futalosine synthase
MNVMDVAHRLGLASSITMMFGHVETIEDRIEHLEFVRQQQDKSLGRLPIADCRLPIDKAAAFANALETGALNGGAFTAFICWTFQPDNAVLKAPTVGAHEYLRTQALGRIYLDNIPSVQSSWVTQGLDIGQVALKYGANDLGSIMIEENVVSAAGTTFRMGVADMQRLITDLGYEAHQRDNWYRLIAEGQSAGHRLNVAAART